MSISDEKAKIRKEMRRRRLEIPSYKLAGINYSLPGFISAIEDEELQTKLSDAKRIALYRAFKGEVPVDGLSEFFMKKGITCCFPKIENGIMTFYDCGSLDEDEFEESSIGIKEPSSGKKEVDPKSIDIVVLPAVAYNEEGTRLGMGGGYYDRYIGALGTERPYLLGICYEFQICSDIPVETQDISADFIAVIPEEEYGE